MSSSKISGPRKHVKKGLTNLSLKMYGISYGLRRSVGQREIPNQDTNRVRSDHILNAKAKVMVNLSKLNPVAFSAAVSPMIDMMPTYSRSTKSSKEATSSTSDARQRRPLCQY